MLPNIFDRSSKSDDTNPKFEARFFLDRDRESKDKLSSADFAIVERSEGDIWRGIKAEKAGKLELAAFYYRSAIKSDPECIKAYQLLSQLLKKIREARVNKIDRIATAEYLPAKTILPTDKTEKSPQKRRARIKNVAQTITSNSKTMMDDNLGIARDNDRDSKQSTKSVERVSKVNLIPVNSDFNEDSQNSSIQLQKNSVLLPQMEVSPAGDLVLEDNLNVSQVYIEQALFFFEQKQWDKSIVACQEALRLCSSMGEAYKIWGNCLQKSGNSADAIGIYAKALELQPNMAEIYCNLGSIYAKSKKWQQAIEYYQKSIIIDPNCAAPHRNLAKVWDGLKEYDKSEECFFKALAIKPELISAQNHFELAGNLAQENRIDKAIACYQHCIHLEPQFLNAYVRLAQLLEAKGEKEAALSYYRQLARLQVAAQEVKSQSKSRQQIRNFILGKKHRDLPQLPSKNSPTSRRLAPAKTETQAKKIARYRQKIQQQPNTAGLQWELGNLYFQVRQWQNAIACYLKAIELEPRQAKYHLSLGKAWSKAGDGIKANQSYYQGFSLEPDKIAAENHLVLGNKLLEQRQIKPAIACYRRAISLKPELIEAYWQLGKILMSGGKIVAAIACYQQALKIDNCNSHSYFLLGNALAQNKQFSGAIAAYQQAAAIQPDNADISHNLGEAFYESQQWQAAIAAYQRAIALNPDNSWSHNNLGNAFLKTEQWQPAALSFARAISLKPDFVWSHYNLGEALANLERWSEALTAYQNAQQLDSNLPAIESKIGAILHQRSRQSQQEALKFCQSQLEKDPDNLNLYHQAIALDRKNYELYLGLGKALFKKQQVDEAISILQMGLEIQPQNLELTSALSEAILAKNPNLDLRDVALQVGNRETPPSYLEN